MKTVASIRFRSHVLAPLVLMLTCVCGSLFAAPPAKSDAATLSEGRALTKLFMARDIDAVWARMAPPMRDALQSKDNLAAFRAKVEHDLGEPVDTVSESTHLSDGMRTYVRVVRWSKMPTPFAVQWTIDGGGRVQAFQVVPVQPATEAPSSHLDYRTKADLRLPFDGAWYVFWGGRTLAQNYHAQAADQRFAYDFVVRKDGSSHRGDGKALADYYCWNRPILAPAAGRVVEAVDGLPDQPVGRMDPSHPVGNHVVLDLGNGEYAVLAHLREGSVRVKQGETVARGDALGRCGNSGNTSEPHLHFHLQDKPHFGQRGAEGLPAQFEDYSADGEPVARGEPVKGQTVEAR